MNEFSDVFDQVVEQIDARGLLCPEPLVRCRKVLDVLEEGERVHVLATDPHAEIDFEVFTKRSGHLLLASQWQNEVLHVLIARRASG